MSPTGLDGIRALIYLWLEICYSLWHCNCLYFIGCLKQLKWLDPTEDAYQQRLNKGKLAGRRPHRAPSSWAASAQSHGSPAEKWGFRLFIFLGGIFFRKQGPVQCYNQGHQCTGVFLRDLEHAAVDTNTQQDPAGSEFKRTITPRSELRQELVHTTPHHI